MIKRPGDAIWRTPFDDADAQFGQALAGTFLGVLHRGAGDANLPPQGGFGFARLFAEPLRQRRQVSFGTHLFDIHAVGLQHSPVKRHTFFLQWGSIFGYEVVYEGK